MANAKYSFLKRKYINDGKWNECVEKNSDFPYSFTWYLDSISENWGGLVLRDYQAVFPIVLSKKFGLNIVINPYYSQQLGMVSDGTHPLFENACLRFLQRKYIFSSINLHYKSVAESSKLLTERPNYILRLNRDYKSIKEGYSKNTQRNLNKAIDKQVYTKPFTNPTAFAKYCEEINLGNIKSYSKKHTLHLEQLITACAKHNIGEMIAAYIPGNEKPIALGFFVKFKNRIINLVPLTLEHGRDSNGMTFILNEIIQRNSNTDTIFDFEGSSVEGVARFYKGFGALPQNYWNYKHTVLDVFLQPLKGQTYLL